MKATHFPDGRIEVDGTPDELLEYVRKAMPPPPAWVSGQAFAVPPNGISLTPVCQCSIVGAFCSVHSRVTLPSTCTAGRPPTSIAPLVITADPT